MGKKDELIAKAEELGIQLDASETIADLEAKIAAHELDSEGPMPPEGVVRRKVNRGSSRRISRAFDNLRDALKTFRAEIDLQAYEADEDGNRIGPHPLVSEAEAFEASARDQVNALVTMK